MLCYSSGTDNNVLPVVLHLSYIGNLCNHVMQAAADGNSGAGVKKSRVNRKHVIIAVTCAVVTVIVIAGVLVGVKFFLDSTNDIVKVTAVDFFAEFMAVILPIFRKSVCRCKFHSIVQQC